MTSCDQDWREERRLRLLEAAGRVFTIRPYGQVTMDDIAREANVGKPTIYRYFTSKTALFTAVFAHAIDELDARLAEVLRREHAIEPRLRGLIAAIVPMVRDHLLPLRFLDQRGAAADQSRRQVFRENRKRISGHLARALHEGVEAGELVCRDTAAVAELMIGMIWSGAAASLGDDRTIASTVTDLLLRGLLPRALEDGPAIGTWERRGTARLGANVFEGTGG